MILNLKYIVYFQIIYNCFIKIFISDFKLPSFLNYVTDIINIILLIGVIINFKKNKGNPIKNTPIFIAYILFFINLISFLIDFSNPALFLWGFRNIYRFFIFFYCCIHILNKEDIIKIFHILEKIYIINFFICIYEYFIRGIQFDSLGGIFGNNTIGGNGPLNVFIILMDIYYFIMYFNKQNSMFSLVVVLATSLILASVAELKIVYFEIILLLILVPIFIKFNVKMIITVILTLLIGYGALSIYIELYPNNEGFLSLDFVEEYALNSSYGSSTDINRLSAISTINERYFLNNTKYKFIGMGLGNAETSQISMLNSTFFKRYGDTFKYTWFSHAFMYLESGYIGLILYISFFLKIIYDSFMSKNKDIYMSIAFLFSIYCIIFLFYNQSLRIETMGYTIFFVLSIPYILKREELTDEKSCSSNNESWI